jgi:hypothetical protein
MAGQGDSDDEKPSLKERLLGLPSAPIEPAPISGAGSHGKTADLGPIVPWGSETGALMLTNNRFFEDEVCPVPDQVLGELYGANSHTLDELIATVSPARRARLATYCYRRAHLKEIALAIAANCDEDDLSLAAGKLGKMLFAISRETSELQRDRTPFGRRKVTLFAGPLKETIPVEELADE